MSNMFLDVATFIDACDQERNEDNVKLYKKLIDEEYNEFLEAYYSSDTVEELDACMDMIWVILGYCYMKNFDVAGAWDEVANTNLAKVNPETGKVTKNDAGKVMKPEGWKPPDLSKFV